MEQSKYNKNKIIVCRKAHKSYINQVVTVWFEGKSNFF